MSEQNPSHSSAGSQDDRGSEPVSSLKYQPIENYGVIGNMHTVALVSRHRASIDFFCYPDFDSPSVFCRLLDHNKGGFFEICPSSSPHEHKVQNAHARTKESIYNAFFESAGRMTGALYDSSSDSETKQEPSFRPSKLKAKQLYLPSSNILITRFSGKEGITQVTDLMPVNANGSPSHPWVVRKVECIRGSTSMKVTCSPSFDYARSFHKLKISEGMKGKKNPSVSFHSGWMSMDLRYLFQDSAKSDSDLIHNLFPVPPDMSPMEPENDTRGECVRFIPPKWKASGSGDRPAATAVFDLHEGQMLIFALRRIPQGMVNNGFMVFRD